MNRAITVVADVKAVLGEGPVWVAREESLYWLDIKGHRLFRINDRGFREWPTPMRVGSIAPRDGGGFIAGTDGGFYTVEVGDQLAFTRLFDPEEDRPDIRFNDGKVDRHGRFWAGTMDDTEQEAVGILYRLDPDHGCTKQDEGYGVTNGPAFNRAGDIMYHTDSARRRIYRFTLSPDGILGPREIFAQFKGDEGYPDGMTVDAEGCLWVAFWDGWAVRRFGPDAALLDTIEVPVQRPTSIAFGGPDLDRMYITSARVGLDETALAVQPYAGALLMVEAGIKGIAERPFAG
jgi:D-xylonolactonase